MDASELVSHLFEENVPELVSQALDENFVNFLLELLKSGLDAAENPSAAKAQVVKALKAMTKYGHDELCDGAMV